MRGLKKFRGKRRYYRNLARLSEAFRIDPSDGAWFDLSHTHFDWKGHSRRGLSHRRLHLLALFKAFQRALAQVSRAALPIQVFVSIAPEREAEQDALYVHSENPNGTPFPYAFANTVWDVPVPELVRPYLEPTWQVGASDLEGQTWYTVRAAEGTCA